MKNLTAVETSLLAGVLSILKPPPDITISEWADEFRMLSAEASSEHGKWKTSRTPYLKGIMDAVGDRDIFEVVCMMAAQLGKTEFILNILGYHIHQDPAPILALQPTLEMAEAFSKDRIAPMLRDTPALAGKVKDARARDSGNTMLHKSYPGGQLTLAGANSPSSLASRPKRLVLCDEVDRYPLSAGTEGDPVNLAKKRSTTFYNRKSVLVSTPTIKGASRIEKAFEASDRRYYMVPCPHCEKKQRLMVGQLRYPPQQPELAYYECEFCKEPIKDRHKRKMLRLGEWFATRPSAGVAGFHLSELYSPWVKFADTARSYVNAHAGGVEMIKEFTNTALGETYEEQIGTKLDWEMLFARREGYRAQTVPMGGVVLTAGVDIQHNRIAYVIRSWGEGEESWLVDHAEIHGDTSKPDVWNRIDSILNREYEHASGQYLRIKVACIDSSDGARTAQVYKFCWDRSARHILAIKGASTKGGPIMGKPSSANVNHLGQKLKGDLWNIGVDTGKNLISSRVRLTDDGPGKYHFHEKITEEYCKQWLGEKRVSHVVKGFTVFGWEKIGPNEVFDCENYALAAAYYYGIQRTNFRALTKKLKLGTVKTQQDAAKHPAKPDMEAPVTTSTPVPSPAPEAAEPAPVEKAPLTQSEQNAESVRQAVLSRRRGRSGLGGPNWIPQWR